MKQLPVENVTHIPTEKELDFLLYRHGSLLLNQGIILKDSKRDEFIISLRDLIKTGNKLVMMDEKKLDDILKWHLSPISDAKTYDYIKTNIMKTFGIQKTDLTHEEIYGALCVVAGNDRNIPCTEEEVRKMLLYVETFLKLLNGTFYDQYENNTGIKK